MSDAITEKRRRAPRWLWISFFVSLALNLIVLGAAAGALWHFTRSKVYREAGAPRHFEWFLRRLPEERKAVFLKVFRDNRAELAPLRNDVRSARLEAVQIMERDIFDRERFAEANRRLHAARAKVREARGEVFQRVIEQMTVEERRMFVDWRRRHWRRWNRWREPE